MEKAALNQLLLDALRQHDRPDLLWYKQNGVWRPLSTRTFLRRAASLAQNLRALGVGKGDRVALFSENRPEWHIADLAILGLGAVNVPLYPAESSERVHYILKHSDSCLCFLSGREQREKVKAALNDLRELKVIIPFEAGLAGEAAGNAQVLAWESLARPDVAESVVEDFERRARSQQPDDVASLIYTSGTTGTPKGVLLTQHNFAFNAAANKAVLGNTPADLAVSMLPLCHIYERTNCYVYLLGGTSIAYAESFDKVTENLHELRPTVMAVVPRFFEKFYARLMETVGQMSAVKRKLFEWAVALGRQATPYRLAQKPMPGWLALRYRLAEWLVYRKVRERLGGRLRSFISGGAPLARELNEFFHALGMTILEGYGLTETSPVITVNLPGATKLGTVGPPLPGVEVKIAEDGEILTRGPHVMKGYFKMETETAEALRDGWFHTGDIGFLDDDGFLTVTDRKKDLLKTAGGKFIAPQPIENRLRQSPYIENAVVIGDRRKYAAALVVPNVPALERMAQERGITFRSSAELLAHPAVRTLIAAEVEKVNDGLAQYERLKRFALVDKDFTFDGGQLTYTQKIRRRMVEEHYRDLIESLYTEEAAASA